MNGWGFPGHDWHRFATWLVDSRDEAMHRTQGVGGLRAGLRHQQGLSLSVQDQEWLTLGATAHATQLALLDRIRETAISDVIVLKGPEVASLYPEPAWRNSTDLDLFSVDAEALWHALVRDGFAPTEVSNRHDRHHHLVPLYLPGFRLGIEVHRSLGWPTGAAEPSPDELLRAAVGSRVHPSFRSLSPEAAFAHQLQHAWHGAPYGTLRDLVDLAALWERADPALLQPFLVQTRLDRLHGSTRRFAGHVIAGSSDRASMVARLVARPALRRQSETMHLAVTRRVAGLVGAAGLQFAAKSVAHDVAQVIARRADRGRPGSDRCAA